MPAPTPALLLDGLVFPEGPRWHEGRLWFSDMHAKEVVAVDMDGKRETIVQVPQQPSGLGWLPDGRLLIVSMLDRKLLRLDPDGLREHADLSGLASHNLNDMVVDGEGRAYVGNFGFDPFGGDEPRGHGADPRHPGGRGPRRRGRSALSQRRRGHARRRHLDHRRVVRQAAQCLRHRRRRLAWQPPPLGRGARHPGRHRPRRRGLRVGGRALPHGRRGSHRGGGRHQGDDRGRSGPGPSSPALWAAPIRRTLILAEAITGDPSKIEGPSNGGRLRQVHGRRSRRRLAVAPRARP